MILPDDDRGAAAGRLHFVLLPALLFLLIPMFVLSENIEDLGDFDPRAFVFLALLAVGGWLSLLLMDSILARAVGGTFFSTIIEHLFFFVVVTGFVLPASKSAAMADPGTLELDALHVGLAVLLALAMGFVSRSPWRRSLYVAIILFIALNAALSLPALWSLARTPAWDTRSIFRLSSSTNILVLSFDAVSGSAVRETLAERPEIAEHFRGFVFFDRAASSSLATRASTAASLYGNRDFKEDYSTTKQLWHSDRSHLLTNYLNGIGYEVSTYGIYNKEFVERGRRHFRLAPRPPASVLMLLNYSLARALSRLAVLRGDLADRADGRIRDALTPFDMEVRDLTLRMEQSRAPRWKREVFTPTVLDLREYVRRLHVGTTRPVAHFLHFTYTHWPLEFDEECRFRGDDREWFESRQNRRGAREDAQCVLRQASEFIGRLKALRAFDRSLVVLKSDHGRQRRYSEAGTLESMAIRDHWMYGYGRYRPFLAVKDFGPARQSVEHDEKPVMLDDLAKTLCRNSGIQGDCAFYRGYDLLGSDDTTGIADSQVTLFVVESPGSGHRYEHHEGVTIRRGTDVVKSLCEALALESGAPDAACDES